MDLYWLNPHPYHYPYDPYAPYDWHYESYERKMAVDRAFMMEHMMRHNISYCPPTYPKLKKGQDTWDDPQRSRERERERERERNNEAKCNSKSDCQCQKNGMTITPMTSGPLTSTTMTSDSSERGQELLDWVNSRLQAEYVNIAQLCDGSAYCQFMDMMFPGSVSMKKIKFNTRFEHESIENFKILQTALQKVQVDKVIPVVKLIQGRYKENLDFLEWFHMFYNEHYKDGYYDAREARNYITLGGDGVGKKFLNNYQNYDINPDYEQTIQVGSNPSHRQCCHDGWCYTLPNGS